MLNADGRQFGLIVDGLEDPEEIVVKPLSSVLRAMGIFSGATVLGNGGLALILDPGALAARAGVGIAIGGQPEEVRDETITADVSEYLLVETGGAQAALPLSDVLRIERVPRSRLERIPGSGAPVLHFDGMLLPLDDSAGVLTTGGSGEEQLTVVVCRDGGRHVGLAVTQVLDVASGGPLTEAGTQAITAGVTLLKERVTTVVNLSLIPPLPASESSFCELEWPQATLPPVEQRAWSEAPA